MIRPHQRYHHRKFATIQMTVIQQHIILHSHWLIRESIGGDHKGDYLQEAHDLENEWVLDYDPQAPASV